MHEEGATVNKANGAGHASAESPSAESQEIQRQAASHENTQATLERIRVELAAWEARTELLRMKLAGLTEFQGFLQCSEQVMNWRAKLQAEEAKARLVKES